MLSLLPLALVVATGIFAFLWLKVVQSGRPTIPLPPGPKPVPLIGNVHQMPTKGEDWLAFNAWSKQYGNMFHLSIFGKSLIIVSSAQIASELLDKRSSKYSERPTFQMAGEIMGWSKSVVLSQYGDRLKRYRKLLQSVLGRSAAPRFRPLQQQEAKRFVQRMVQTPENLVQHIRHNAAAVIMKIGYGYTVSESSDRYISIAERALTLFAAATIPGAHLVDLVPWLRYFPGVATSKVAKEGHTALMEMVERPFGDVKMALQEAPGDEEQTSFVAESLRTNADDDDHIQWAAASLYAGGADTTVSAVETFFLAMALYPDVQCRAREEIDRVCTADQPGNSRLPTLEDRAALPYTWAVYQECLRWGVITPCQYHVARDEDSYDLGDIEGSAYSHVRIPKDTLIVVNAWSILHNPDSYPKPFEFDPTRYLPASGCKPQPDPREIAFGWGRRRCPGIAVADDYVFATICTTLATLTISNARTKTGLPIFAPNPEVESEMWRYTKGSISHPEPFDVSVVVRSDTAAVMGDEE